jgi:hypothetical protein
MDGKLVADEFLALMKVLTNERYQVGKDSAIQDLMNNIPPKGWEAGRCLNCNGPISHCMEQPIKKSRIMISDTSIPLTHRPPCRG